MPGCHIESVVDLVTGEDVPNDRVIPALAAGWLVSHARTSPTQPTQPEPSERSYAHARQWRLGDLGSCGPRNRNTLHDPPTSTCEETRVARKAAG